MKNPWTEYPLDRPILAYLVFAFCAGGLWIALNVAACSDGAPKTPPDAAPSEVFSPCASACVNLRALGCPAGSPTPKGTTCEAVCENASGTGFSPVNTACLSAAKSCAESAACR